jgi:hypothetical protein
MGSIVDPSEVILELGLSSSITDEERAMVSTAIVRAEAAIKRHLFYDPFQRERTEFYPQQDFSPSGRTRVWEVEGSQAVLRTLAESATCDLFLRHIPVRSISALYIDYDGRAGARVGAFAAETLKTEGTDFWPNYDMVDSDGNKVCRDGILRAEGTWPTTPGSVKIVYTAGYSAEELHGQDSVIDASPINEAVIEEAVRRVRRMFLVYKKKTGPGFAGPFTSEHLGDYSYSADSGGVKEVLGTADLLARTVDKLQDFVNMAYVVGG